MTESRDTSQATGRVAAYLDARDAGLAHIPRIGPGVITGWPRTENDADGEFELTADDLRAVLAEHQQMRDALELVTAERDSLQRHIDDTIARDAARVAKRAKGIADRAAYIAQFSAGPTQDAPSLVGEWQQADEEQA